MGFRLALILFFWVFFSNAQEHKLYRIRTIAFYNVENLFDTRNDSLIFDDERTPEGKYHWTMERYRRKLDHISRVLSEIGSETAKTSPDIIGICEVENLSVIEDLVDHPNLRSKGYGIVHYDSPDERGIDVALLYKKSVFIPNSYASHRLLLFDDDDERNYTRDQLVVGGRLDNEQFYFVVNHWPSRSGGEARSRPYRMAAAKLNKRIVDSIQGLHPDARIISMGDFNDDPISASFKKILKTKGRKGQLEGNDLYNPMEKLYRKGIGSLAYRDNWNLFDQIYFTEALIGDSGDTYRFWKAGVFNPPYLVTPKGRYKGYPFRTYAGGSYSGGYSDHFPVYIYLIREEAQKTPLKEGH
ncbi:endonuclease/exonuclease/phosphatase family protein [Pseudozobellia thermophila]|uniref:Endonuclease/Exonuclease/phosphatase family protein n=1 Tax=Pseudozobellia thermophila TaxID=192903 RepID=A0A1M6AT77_9FLAO|nr:endonuclease/exonuclease/phosphatase family protein [Pseudozobellia thermophila]SHI39719.1 Endonuclease/Exonuclease/phosphatase family protein [Pseudozobellia thermophila]